MMLLLFVCVLLVSKNKFGKSAIWLCVIISYEDAPIKVYVKGLLYSRIIKIEIK